MMKISERCLAAAACVVALALDGRAQSTLAKGSVGVATSAGVYLVENQITTPLHLAPPGVSFADPAIEWLPDTDTFLVTTGATVFAIDVVALNPVVVSITNITPDLTGLSPSTAVFGDLDIDPGTGDIWLLDIQNTRALRVPGPVNGSLPLVTDLALPVSAGSFSLSVDSIQYPLGIVCGTDGGVVRHELDGSTELLAAFFFNDGGGVDTNPQMSAGTLFANASSDQVLQSTQSPNLAYTVLSQYSVYGPRDIEWSTKNYAYILADALNPGSWPLYQPNNWSAHVVRIQVPEGPFGGKEHVTSRSGDSQISGTGGDIAIVTGAFPFTSFYGPTCSGPLGGTPLLEPYMGFQGIPSQGNQLYGFELSNFLPGSTIYSALTALPDLLPVQGCMQLVHQPQWSFEGVGNNSTFDISLPVPSLPSLIGTQAYFQAVAFDSSQYPVFSQGAKISF